ncbi:MAG: hypothetical protein J0J01_09425 [Reyranella sp.]|uniref:hypothetical protein n=1 Tax=Reyranella sp. TaxID=1929291 RepID=UPI001ACB423D|nr:hypothetical protein [Reyranella sp.]MBN9087116.1 hypothetical protein [Reyranella sp.]
MTTNSEGKNVPSKGELISRLNRPTREQVLQAHRERGLMLRGLIAGAVRWVALACAGRRSGGAPRRARQS